MEIHKAESSKRKRTEAGSSTHEQRKGIQMKRVYKKRPYSNKFRSGLAAIVRLVHKDLVKIVDGNSRSLIEERHLKILRNTPFWKFFSLINENWWSVVETLKVNDGIEMIITKFVENSENTFLINNKRLDFRVQDVADILGMQITDEKGESITRHKKVPFYKTYFAHSSIDSRIQISFVKKKLLETVAVDGKEEDFVKFLVLFMAIAFFFTRPGGSYIPYGYLEHISNLDVINRVSWPDMIHSYLMKSVKENVKEPHKVTGCVPLLVFWLCEHVNISDSHKKYLFTDGLPRMAMWNLREVSREIRIILASFSKEEEQLHSASGAKNVTMAGHKLKEDKPLETVEEEGTSGNKEATTDTTIVPYSPMNLSPTSPVRTHISRRGNKLRVLDLNTSYTEEGTSGNQDATDTTMVHYSAMNLSPTSPVRMHIGPMRNKIRLLDLNKILPDID